MDNLLPDLMDTGTRYQHYMELVEIFNTGIEVIKGLSPGMRSEGDEKKQKELEITVARIQARIDVLSKYSVKQAALRKTIDLELPKVPKWVDSKETPCQQ